MESAKQETPENHAVHSLSRYRVETDFLGRTGFQRANAGKGGDGVATNGPAKKDTGTFHPNESVRREGDGQKKYRNRILLFFFFSF